MFEVKGIASNFDKLENTRTNLFILKNKFKMRLEYSDKTSFFVQMNSQHPSKMFENFKNMFCVSWRSS